MLQQRIPDFMVGTNIPRWIKNLVPALGWVVFLFLAGRVWWVEHTQRSADTRRRAVTALLVFTLGISMAAGLTRRELWPFSAWSMIPDVRSQEVGHARVFAIGADGQEYVVDSRSWHPLQWEELIAWLDLRFTSLTVAERNEASRWLLDRANAGRIQAREGRRVGYLQRFLGPLTAPEHMLHPVVWSRAEDAPAEPFFGLRIIREWWNVDEGRTDAAQVRREVLHEFREREP